MKRRQASRRTEGPDMAPSSHHCLINIQQGTPFFFSVFLLFRLHFRDRRPCSRCSVWQRLVSWCSHFMRSRSCQRRAVQLRCWSNFLFFFAVGTYLRITIVKVKKRNSSFYFSFISLPSRFFFFSPFFFHFQSLTQSRCRQGEGKTRRSCRQTRFASLTAASIAGGTPSSRIPAWMLKGLRRALPLPSPARRNTRQPPPLPWQSAR